jgi:hypothetical protein
LLVKDDEAKPADKDAVEFKSIIGDQSSIDKLGNDLMNDILGDMKKISGDEKNLNIDIKKNEEFLNKNDSGLQNLLSKLSNSKTNS